MRALRCSLAPLSRRSVRLHSTNSVAYNAGLWLNRRQYGDEEAPVMGSWGNAFSEEALSTRHLYCKALVYASGATRLSRDWIAGNTALVCPNQALLTIALQYNACEADVAALRKHFLSLWLAKGAEKDAEGAAEAALEGEDPTAALDPTAAQDVRAAENYVLARLPEVRCFLYDAMTASLFYVSNDLDLLEQSRDRVMRIGRDYFGLTNDDMAPIWRLVEAELIIKKDKIRALGQPRRTE